MKYTKGPWSFYRNLPDNLDEQYRICGPITHKTGKQFTLAEVGGFSEEEAEANAHLIANVPNLLEACKGALAALTQNKTYPADIEAAKSFLITAIAKAEAT